MMYYSAASNSFYPASIYGAKTKRVVDPEFEWPLVEVPDPNYQGEGEPPLVEVRDESIEPPLVEVPNPACTLPADAVEISNEYHQALIAGQRTQCIAADENGYPVLVDPPPLALDDLFDVAMRRINKGYSAAITQILVDYPDAETLSFDKQEAQARAWSEWQAAGAVPTDEPATPYLDAMLAERPIGKVELVERIIAKADQFTAAHGQATGRRQRLEDEAKAALEAEDRAALEAIGWSD